MVGPFAHHRFDAMRLQVFLGIRLDAQHHVGARLGAAGGRHGEAAAPIRRPGPGLVAAGAARGDFHLLRHHERRIEADTKLPDQAGAFLRVGVGQGFTERAGAGAGDGAQVGDHVLAGHADAVVGDGQGAAGLVRHDAHLGFAGRGEVRLGQRLEAAAVDGVGGVGDQFAQEDFTLRIQRIHHQIEQPPDLGAEFMLFGRWFVKCVAHRQGPPLRRRICVGLTDHSTGWSAVPPRRDAHPAAARGTATAPDVGRPA